MAAQSSASQSKGGLVPPFSLGFATPLPILPLLAAALLVLCGVNADHFPPWFGFHSEAPAFAASALLLAGLVRQAAWVRWTPALWLLLALVATAWMQFGAGLVAHAGDAWLATAYLAVLAIAWMWGAATVRSGQPGHPLLIVGWALILLALVLSFQALAQWLDIIDHFGGWIFQPGVRRALGNIGQPNIAATLLLMGSAAAAVFMLQGRLPRAGAWPLLALFGWSVVLTQSRTAMLSAAVMGVLVLAVGVRSEQVRRYRLDVLAWLVFLVLASWVVAAIPWEGPELRSDDGSGIGRRFLIWKQLLAGLAEHPLSGYGWLQVSSAQQAGALRVPGIEQVTYAHSAVLDLLVFVGVPLGLLVLGLVLGWLALRLRRLGAGNAVAGMGLFVLVPLLVHMQLELPHAHSFLLLPAGALLGVFEAQTDAAGARSWRVPAWGLAAAAVSWVALLGALAYEYSLAEEDFRVNRFENRRLGRTPDDYRAPDMRLLTQLGEVLQAMRLRAAPGMSNADLDLLVRASTRYSWAPLHYRTALALALNGRPDAASRQLAVMKGLFAPVIWDEGRDTWLLMREGQYPQLRAVQLP